MITTTVTNTGQHADADTDAAKAGTGAPPRGFRLFEFCLVAVLAAVLSVNLFHRLGEARLAAQQAQSRQVLAAVQATYRVRVAQAAGDRAALARLAAENPMTWLARLPANYRGETGDAGYANLPDDTWVFDLRDKSLVYLPTGYKSLSFPSTTFLKFKVEFP